MYSYTAYHLLNSPSASLSPDPKCKKQDRICDVLFTSSRHGIFSHYSDPWIASSSSPANCVGCTERTRLSHCLCSSRQDNCASAKTTTTAAEAFFGCCLSSPLSIEDWCEPSYAGHRTEPILSWQPLIHIRSGPVVLTNEPLEVYDVSNRFPTELAEKNRSFQ